MDHVSGAWEDIQNTARNGCVETQSMVPEIHHLVGIARKHRNWAVQLPVAIGHRECVWNHVGRVFGRCPYL